MWFTQNLLLGSERDLDDIISAILKTRKNAGKIHQQLKG